MKSRITRKILAVVLSLSLMLQLGIPVLFAEAGDLTEETKIIKAFATLSEDVKNITVPVGTKQEEVLDNLPETLMTTYEQMSTENEIEVSLEEITWDSDQTFSTEIEAEFVFTAKLADKSYTFGDGVEIPEIAVSVIDKPISLFEAPVPYAGLVDGAVAGKDITTKGLDFSRSYNMPKVITQYKAGNGYVLVTPAKDSISGKLTLELNNATITSNSGKALHLPSGETELVITGTNELKANFSWNDSCIYADKSSLSITGEGILSAGDYGIELKGKSTFECEDTVTLNLIAYAGGAQEVFGNATILGGNLQKKDAALILHDNSQLTLIGAEPWDRVESDFYLHKDLSIGKDAHLIIDRESLWGEGVKVVIGEGSDPLPIITSKGGSIIVRGELSFSNSSYLKDMNNLNITTEREGKIKVAGRIIDPTSGKFIFNDVDGEQFKANNGGEYTCGKGTVKWEPVVDGGILAGGTITLTNTDIKIKEGNESPAITIIGGDNVPITVNVIGKNTLENNYGTGIAIDNLRLTGSGNLNVKGNIPIVYQTDFDKSDFTGKLNAMVVKKISNGSGFSHYGTVYGTVPYTSDYNVSYNGLTIENGAELTIETGALFQAHMLTQEDAIINNGRIINNGTLGLGLDVNEEELANWIQENLNTLNLEGKGIVEINLRSETKSFFFTNKGESVLFLKENLDFSKAKEDIGELETDGYHWDYQQNKLTLQNLMMSSDSEKRIPAIKLPEGENVTLELKGANKIVGFYNAIHQGIVEKMGGVASEAKGSLTVCGDGTLIAEEQKANSIVTTKGKFILESGNVVLIPKDKARLACVGMEITGGNFGDENMSAAIYSLGDFKMSGGKVISGDEDQTNGSLLVDGDLTLSGGELITGKGRKSIWVWNGNVSISGGKLTVHNDALDYRRGIEVQLSNEDKKVSISDEAKVDIKAGNSALTFVSYGKGKGIFETRGMTVTTNPRGGKLNSAPNKESSIKAVFALTTGEKLEGNEQYISNACNSVTVAKRIHRPSRPSEDSDENGGAGLGEDSGTSNNENATVTVPSLQKPNFPTQVTALISATVTNGIAKANVAQSLVVDAIQKAQEEAKKNENSKNGIAVEIKLDTKNSLVQNASVNLEKAALNELVKAGIKEFDIDMGATKMKLDLESLKAIQKQVGSEVVISAKKLDNSRLSAEAKAVIGDRPAFDFIITDTDGQKLTSFGKGEISASLLYTLGANEKAENIAAYYIDSAGKIWEIPESLYDEKSKRLFFKADPFSRFAVGYKENKAADIVAAIFTDITGHWAKNNIDFVTARGLFRGTGEGKFSPEMSMTRGMFVTVLGRLADADLSNYKSSSFTDVKADTYYMPSIEWARKNKIINGISATDFAPDQAISREQMAVIMANYTKFYGLELSKVEAEKTFADHGQISSYAQKAVKQMQIAGIIGGKNHNKIDPQVTATRAEVSAVLKRFVGLME